MAFIIEHIVRHQVSPTLDEIAARLVVSKPRARELVDQLVEGGQVERTPGAQRNLRVRDVSGSRVGLEDALRHLGWTTAPPMGHDLQKPLPNVQLPIFPPFDQIPDVD